MFYDKAEDFLIKIKDILAIEDFLDFTLIQEKNVLSYKNAKRLAKQLEKLILHAPEKKDVIFSKLLEYNTPLSSSLEYYLNLTINNDQEKALKCLERTLSLLSKDDPDQLLEKANLYYQKKDFEMAAMALKRALLLYPPYSFLVNSKDEIRDIIIKAPEHFYKRKIKIAVLSSTVTSFTVPSLKTLCFREGIYASIYEGFHKNYKQEILHEDSTLYEFKPDFVIIIGNSLDLQLEPDNYLEAVDKSVNQLTYLWDHLQEKNPCHIIQVGYNLSNYPTWGSLEETMPGGRNRTITEINLKLSSEVPKRSGLSFLDINKVQMVLGDKFISSKEWYIANNYPSTEALPLFIDHILSQIKAVLGLNPRVLVTDLDNTLWGGVIGEDGLENIILDNETPEGKAYVDLQKYLLEIDERGVLLAVCSKNNLEDAYLSFEKHPAMLLKKEDFIIFTANWESKATNIKNMAQNLSLGLDSFIFLDDNPLERELVRKNLPEVTVIECDSTPVSMMKALKRGLYFESIKLTLEDRERYKNYKENIDRTKFENTAKENNVPLDEFLKSLNMVATCKSIDKDTLPRAAQLINKSNQFNLTTKRYSEEQIKKMYQSKSWLTRYYKVKDRFGDHGIIGVVLIEKKAKDWYIDLWVMSCRTLSRKIEYFLFCDLVDLAEKSGVKKIIGKYIPTAKNIIVKDLYKDLGFTYDTTNDTYIYDLTTKPKPTCDFIEKTI